MKIEFKRSPEYSKNTRFWGKYDHCAICGRVIKDTSKAALVHIAEGGACLVTDDESVDPAGDMFWFPVGADCLRKHPEYKPFAKLL